MNDSRQLTSRQQDLLLRGLRYIRSSVALEPCEFTPEVDAERRRQYAELSELESLINGRKAEMAAR